MEPSVPFHGDYSRMEGSAWVNARISGIARLEPPALVLQVREQRQRIALSVTSTVSADDATTTTVLPLDDVVSLEFRAGLLLAPHLVLTVRRLELLDAFPWADGARLKLSVRLGDRAAARELALVAASELIDRDLARLEGRAPGELAP